MEISYRTPPCDFACFCVQGHDGIVKPADEDFAVSEGHTMVCSGHSREKEPRELRLVVESVKLP